MNNQNQHCIQALIIDDERLARNSLKRLLSSFTEIEICAEAENATRARDLIEKLRPDVLFLDIQMPKENGFELLESLDFIPIIVFVTAFDEYALKAFDTNALDYLVKPIDPERLDATMRKIIHSHTAINRSNSTIFQPAHETTKPLFRSIEERFFVRDSEHCWFVRLGDIRLFKSEGSYTRLHFNTNAPLVLRSLTALEKQLPPQIFFRANRQHIVNLLFLQHIEQLFDGRLQFILTDGTRISASRRQSLQFKTIKSL